MTESSGNVFADLNVVDPDEALVRADLVGVIAVLVNANRLTQTRAAELLGIDQPKVSALMFAKRKWRTWRDSNPRHPVLKFGGTGGGRLFASVRQYSSLAGIRRVLLATDDGERSRKSANGAFCGQIVVNQTVSR